MKIIEKIEIRNFRSFNGKNTIGDLCDLNIFSGSNDSGKSNILRALNLFFNNEISNNIPFDIYRDLNNLRKEKVHKVVEVKVYFNLGKRKNIFIPSSEFSISKFFDRDNRLRNYLYIFTDKDGREVRVDSRSEFNKGITKETQYRQQFLGFLRHCEFYYIPAIREENFFRHLYGKVISKIKNAEEDRVNEIDRQIRQLQSKVLYKREIKRLQDKKASKDEIETLKNPARRKEKIKELENRKNNGAILRNSINSLEANINDFAESMFSSVVSFLPSEFRIIQENLIDFFEAFDIGTGKEKNISLKLRGDGLQAKFIPRMLDFLSKKQLEKEDGKLEWVHDGNQYCFWGFEEPENSSEYKNQQELAKQLTNELSDKKQIFITTHSEEFLSLRGTNRCKVSVYGVKYSSGISVIKKYADEKRKAGSILEEILNDLGVPKEKKLIARLKQLLDVGGDDVYKKVENLKNELSKTILLVEDEYDQIYKIAWLKLNRYKCEKEVDLEIFDEKSNFKIHRGNGRNDLQMKLLKKYSDEVNGKKAIGLFDFDDGLANFVGLKNASDDQKAKWPDKIEGDEKKECLWKTRIDNSDIHAMMLPVPASRKEYASLRWIKTSHLSVEHLIDDRDWKKIGIEIERKKDGDRDIEYSEFKGKKKNNWKKLFALKQKEFENFKPLFDKINKLIES